MPIANPVKSLIALVAFIVFIDTGVAQDAQAPPAQDLRMYEIVSQISSANIEASIRTLVSFGTRNTLSETESDTRGIGAARRWIRVEFERISEGCNGCLDVSFVSNVKEAATDNRLEQDGAVVNVVAVQEGTRYPNRYVIMSGDIDSRASNGFDPVAAAPVATSSACGYANRSNGSKSPLSNSAEFSCPSHPSIIVP